MRARPSSFLTAFLILWGGLPAVRAATVEPGEYLIAEMNCVACHAAAPEIEQRLASRRSPKLGLEGARLNALWLEAFLLDPQREQPGTLMPDLLAGLEPAERTEAAAALTAYLVSIQPPAPATSPGAAERERADGQALYHTVGCVACHPPFVMPDGQPDTSGALAELQKTGPLGDLARKWPTTELAAFLLDPLRIRPSGRMPTLNLSAGEARALAAYLVSTDPAPAPPASAAPDPARIASGRQWFAELNCAACHRLDAPGRPARPLARLTGRQPAGCLSPQPKKGVPKFEITDRQRVVVLAQLGTQAVLTDPLTPRQAVTREMTTFNCYACHVRDRRGGAEGLRRAYFTGAAGLGEEGHIPPSLNGIGAKLAREPLTDIIAQGMRPRAGMNTRMPGCGAENAGPAVAAFLAADASTPANP